MKTRLFIAFFTAIIFSSCNQTSEKPQRSTVPVLQTAQVQPIVDTPTVAPIVLHDKLDSIVYQVISKVDRWSDTLNNIPKNERDCFYKHIENSPFYSFKKGEHGYELFENFHTWNGNDPKDREDGDYWSVSVSFELAKNNRVIIDTFYHSGEDPQEGKILSIKKCSIQKGEFLLFVNGYLEAHTANSQKARRVLYKELTDHVWEHPWLESYYLGLGAEDIEKQQSSRI